MSLAGKLEDVPLADVMQFIHLGRRTGTLSLERGEDRAEINFHRGAIVGAWSPQSRRLGELLLDEGILGQEELHKALRAQRDEAQRRSLGQILLSSGTVSVADVREAIKGQIERTIYELVTWSHGSFIFELDTLKPVDDIAIFPGDLIPDIDLNTQMVLLEAARIYDESNREGEQGDATQPMPAPPPRPRVERHEQAAELFDDTQNVRRKRVSSAADESGGSEDAVAEEETSLRGPMEDLITEVPIRPTLQVVAGGDRELVADLESSLAPFGADVVVVDAQEAGGQRFGENPIVAFELRSGETTLDQLSSICHRRPGLPVICILDDIADTARAYSAGAAAVVPRDVGAISGCFTSMTRFRGLASRATPSEAKSRTAFAKLRRVVADLRSGVFSATVALNLMNIIAESVERAVLFLVKRDRLSALGAFGFTDENRPLAEVTRGLSLDMSQESALTEAVRVGRALSVSFDEAQLPTDLARIIGRPKNGQVVVFPVLGSDRVILVIYTDNGPLDRPIEEIDIIDLAAAEVGIAFENELLRRQLSEQKS